MPRIDQLRRACDQGKTRRYRLIADHATQYARGPARPEYLSASNRRHGVLVISHNGETRSCWDIIRRHRIIFAEVIEDLQQRAEAINANATGRVVVAVQRFDTTPGRMVAAAGAAATARIRSNRAHSSVE